MDLLKKIREGIIQIHVSGNFIYSIQQVQWFSVKIEFVASVINLFFMPVYLGIN